MNSLGYRIKQCECLSIDHVGITASVLDALLDTTNDTLSSTHESFSRFLSAR